MIVNKRQDINYNWPQEEWQPRQRKRTKNHSKMLFKLVSLLVFIMVAGCFLHLFNQNRIAKANYRMIQKTQELEKIIRENDVLEVKIAQLESLERIETIAKNELQMVKPDYVQWIPASN